MTKYISRQETRIIEFFERYFEWKNCPGAGFGFPLNPDGSFQDMAPAAKANLDKCLSGEFDVIDHGVRDCSYPTYQPAVIECENCGTHVTLDSAWANECRNCHVEYNGFGQRLAPRSQWGEETGEVFAARNWSNDH